MEIGSPLAPFLFNVGVCSFSPIARIGLFFFFVFPVYVSLFFRETQTSHPWCPFLCPFFVFQARVWYPVLTPLKKTLNLCCGFEPFWGTLTKTPPPTPRFLFSQCGRGGGQKTRLWSVIPTKTLLPFPWLSLPPHGFRWSLGPENIQGFGFYGVGVFFPAGLSTKTLPNTRAPTPPPNPTPNPPPGCGGVLVWGGVKNQTPQPTVPLELLVFFFFLVGGETPCGKKKTQKQRGSKLPPHPPPPLPSKNLCFGGDSPTFGFFFGAGGVWVVAKPKGFGVGFFTTPTTKPFFVFLFFFLFFFNPLFQPPRSFFGGGCFFGFSRFLNQVFFFQPPPPKNGFFFFYPTPPFTHPEKKTCGFFFPPPICPFWGTFFFNPPTPKIFFFFFWGVPPPQWKVFLIVKVLFFVSFWVYRPPPPTFFGGGCF